MLGHLEALRRTDTITDLRKCIVDPNYNEQHNLDGIQSEVIPEGAGIFKIRMKLDDSVPKPHRSGNCRSPDHHLIREMVDIHHTDNLRRQITDLDHHSYYFKIGWPDPELEGIERNHLLKGLFEDNFIGRIDVAWIAHERAESLGKVLHAIYIMVHGHSLPMDIIVNKYFHSQRFR